MFDSIIKNTLDSTLRKTADKLNTAAGIGPNQITIYGFVIGLVGCIAIGLQSYMLGLFLILLNRLADGLDGTVSRFDTHEEGTMKGPFGTYLDIILNMVFFGAFVFLFALSAPEQSIGAAFLLFSLIGLFATDLGDYMFSEENIRSERSFVHPTRLVECTEITLFIAFVCFYPETFSAMAVILGMMCWVTAFSRIWFTFWELRTNSGDGIDHGPQTLEENMRHVELEKEEKKDEEEDFF